MSQNTNYDTFHPRNGNAYEFARSPIVFYSEFNSLGLTGPIHGFGTVHAYPWKYADGRDVIVADGGHDDDALGGFRYLAGPGGMTIHGLNREVDGWSADVFHYDPSASPTTIQMHYWSDEPHFYVAEGWSIGNVYYDLVPLVVPEPTGFLLAVGIVCVLLTMASGRFLSKVVNSWNN